MNEGSRDRREREDVFTGVPDFDGHLICADVGGSFIDIALVSGKSEILVREKHATPKADWEAFASVFASFADRHGQRGTVPIAIATAGLVDPHTHVVTSANIACIDGRPLQTTLESRLGVPTAVINDADAFVLAEATLGIAVGHRRVLGVILGTGVGGGLLVDGRILTGPGGVGGEWGHGQVVARSPKAEQALPLFRCGCGAWGCLDTVGGARGMERLHRFLHGADASSREIVDDWTRGLRRASETIDLYCGLVAGPLVMLLNAFPATIVPVGGGLASSRRLIAELDRRARKQMLARTPSPLLIPTKLEQDAGILGALVFARNQQRWSA